MIFKIQSPLKVFRNKSIAPQGEAVKLTDGNIFYSLFPGLFGSSKSYDTNTIAGQMQAYSACAPVNSVVNKQADALKRGRFMLIDKDGNEVKPNAKLKYIAQFLTRPNPLQDFKQFLATAYAFSKIHGIAYAIPVYGLMRKEPTSFWIVPNFMVTPQYTGKIFGQTELGQIISGYKVQGFDKPISADDMLVFRDSGVSNTALGNDWLNPQSRLVPLRDQVNSVIASTDSWLTISKRKGIPLGIISSGAKDMTSSIPLTDTEKNEIHEEMNGAYSMTGEAKKFILSTAAINFTQISLPVRDLMLLEGVEANSRHICNQYNYPFELMGYANNASLSNGGEIKAAEKRHYENQIIPDAESICETINEWWGLESSGVLLKVFYDHLDVFQKGKEETARAIMTMCAGLDRAFINKIITVEEYRGQLSTVMDIDPEKVNGTQYYDGNKGTKEATPADDGSGEGTN